jgi:hypothetical protein
MPVLPKSRDFGLLATTWPRQLAAASVLIILIFGALNINLDLTGTLWPKGSNGAISTSVITSTAAVTNTPTVTATSINFKEAEIGNTAVPLTSRNGFTEENPALTPAPMAPVIE